MKPAVVLALAAAVPGCAPSAPPARASELPACVVAAVTDGDTLRCQDGRRVRLIGIDAPEREQGEWFAPSRDRLRALAPAGATIRLEADVTPRDRYGRTLAWAWRRDILLNERMVREGWAVLYTVAPDVRYADRVRAAQAAARAAGAGLWASGGFDCLPADFRRGRCR